MKAVREYMLYRPMVPGGRDILFSGKITKSGTDATFEAEVTHLTCFLGGMVGMGAKLFNIEEDLNIAKKLSDGCVWAYESMSTGIMPEGAEVYRCKDDSNCPWNETLWMDALDPLAAQRDQDIKDYESKKAAREAQNEQERLAAQSKLAAEGSEDNSAADTEQVKLTTSGFDLAENGDSPSTDADSNPPDSLGNEVANTNSSVADPALESKPSVQKRQFEEGPGTAVPDIPPLPENDTHDELFQKKLEDTEIELQSASPGREVEVPSKHVPKIPAPSEVLTDPIRPPTHKEYVEAKIKREGLAPGFVRIWSNKYILRCEFLFHISI
jgi:mannosyl-oligosaccharide alpha-1,2-mannosidase